jgi:hypothetical protein
VLASAEPLLDVFTALSEAESANRNPAGAVA